MSLGSASPSDPLWTPSQERAQGSNLASFQDAFGHADYAAFHQWSITDLDGFWAAAWDRLGVIGERGERIVRRPTPGMDTITPAEFVAGRTQLRRKLYRYRPEIVATVGVTVFRALFPDCKGAVALGLQPCREHPCVDLLV